MCNEEDGLAVVSLSSCVLAFIPGVSLSKRFSFSLYCSNQLMRGYRGVGPGITLDTDIEMALLYHPQAGPHLENFIDPRMKLSPLRFLNVAPLSCEVVRRKRSGDSTLGFQRCAQGGSGNSTLGFQRCG